MPIFVVESGAGAGVHRASSEAKGLVPPWYGYGSPGFTVESFRVQSIWPYRALAYSLDSSPLTGSSGGK
jgi:hypothetical protein